MNPKQIQAIKRIQEEYKDLYRRPMPNLGITVGLVNPNNLFEWKCTIIGPSDTSYRGGLFKVRIIFPEDYPETKPEVVFKTPIYHLNVKFFIEGNQPLGHICVNTLNDWQKDCRINRVLPELFALLHQNNPDSPYDYQNNARRNEFINNRKLFEEKARYFTIKYANPNAKEVDYTTSWDFSYP